MNRMRMGLLAMLVSFAFAPAYGQAATICKDGSTSVSTGRGTCAGHGGVDAKATSAAKKQVKAAEKQAEKAAKAEKAQEKRAEKAAKEEAKDIATVTCADGTTSKPGRGACSRHGGVGGAVATRPAPSRPAPSLPAPVPTTSPARTRSAARSRAPSATVIPRATTTRADNNDPTDATAQCKDGTYSHAATHRGACSRHGGVATFLP